MLKNKKSLYFKKRIFTYIHEKKKLILVKYNKIIQKYIDISIMNYKYFTGKYIVFGENRTGKEYDFMDNLLFEGEYSNGEKMEKEKNIINGIKKYYSKANI